MVNDKMQSVRFWLEEYLKNFHTSGIYLMRDISLLETRKKFNYLNIYSTFNYLRLSVNFVLENKVGIYCLPTFKNTYPME